MTSTTLKVKDDDDDDHSNQGHFANRNDSSHGRCNIGTSTKDPSQISSASGLHEHSNCNNKPIYSATKVRIVLLVVATLGWTGYIVRSVIAQYLLDRWSDEAGHSRNHNGTPDNTTGRCGAARNGTHDSWVIEENHIQSRVSVATMYYSLTTSLPALASCLVFGALSDIAGRRLPMMVSLLGGTLQVALVILIIRFNLHPNLFYLAYAMDGIGGSYFLNLLACFSVTADISQQKEARILGITFLNCFGNVMCAGINVMVGVLLKKVGYIVATWSIFAPMFISLAVTILFLPETLPTKSTPTPKRGGGHGVSVWRFLDYTTRIFYLYRKEGDARTRRCLSISLFIFFSGMLTIVNVSSIDTLYQKHEPLCWDAAQLGYFSAFRSSGGYVMAFACLCLVRLCGCASDEVLSMAGMLFVAGGFVLEAFVTNTWQMYLVPIVASPGGNIVPITRGVMSVLAGPDRQGVMFSSIALIEVLCDLSANVTFNKVYAATVDFMPGFVYLVMASTAVFTFLLYIPFFHYYNKDTSEYRPLIQTSDGRDPLGPCLQPSKASSLSSSSSSSSSS